MSLGDWLKTDKVPSRSFTHCQKGFTIINHLSLMMKTNPQNSVILASANIYQSLSIIYYFASAIFLAQAHVSEIIVIHSANNENRNLPRYCLLPQLPSIEVSFEVWETNINLLPVSAKHCLLYTTYTQRTRKVNYMNHMYKRYDN